MPKTISAYIYNKQTGLLDRMVISDEYANEETFRAIHVPQGYDAVIELRDDLVLTDPIAIAKASKTEDEIQDIVTLISGIIPLPKKRYALTDAEGKVLDLIDSRTPIDIATFKHDAFQQVMTDVKQRDDVKIGDIIKSNGDVIRAVAPDVLPKDNLTIKQLEEQTQNTLDNP